MTKQITKCAHLRAFQFVNQPKALQVQLTPELLAILNPHLAHPNQDYQSPHEDPTHGRERGRGKGRDGEGREVREGMEIRVIL